MMSTIAEEKLISFKELEKKILDMSVNLAVRSPVSYWSPMMMNLQHPETPGNIGIKEDVRPASRQSMGKWNTGAECTGQPWQLAKGHTFTCWIRQCRWISSTCGQRISAGGAWNLMQRLGERISEEEDHAGKQMHAD